MSGSLEIRNAVTDEYIIDANAAVERRPMCDDSVHCFGLIPRLLSVSFQGHYQSHSKATISLIPRPISVSFQGHYQFFYFFIFYFLTEVNYTQSEKKMVT